MKMKKDSEVAVVDSNLPAYLQEMVGRPARLDDNFDETDIVLPRIALLQGMSEACKEHAEASPGVFWHTGMDFVVDPLKFVICTRRKRYLLMAPLEDGQGVLARSNDAVTWDSMGEWTIMLDRKTKRTATWKIDDTNVARSGLLNWGTSDPAIPDSPPAATLFYDYVVILPEYPEFGLTCISLARSAIKRAKKGLNDKIALHASNGRPMQSLLFEAKVTTENSDFGSFYNWQFAGAGFADEDVFKAAVAYGEQLREYAVEDETGNTEDARVVNDDF